MKRIIASGAAIFHLLFFLLLFTLPSPGWAAQTLVVQTDILNVRSGPGTDFSRVGQVQSGQEFDVLEEKNGWYKIKLVSGTIGWVAGWLVDLSGTRISSWKYRTPAAPVFRPAGDLSQRGKNYISWHWEEKNSGVQVVINGSQSFEYAVNKSPDGLKITVEINGLEKEKKDRYTEKINYGNVEKIRCSSGEGKTVIEIYPNESISYRDWISPDGLSLTMDFAASGILGKTIVIDPGHGRLQPGGWMDPGAVGPRGLKESDVVLDIAGQVQEILSAQGARVVMTRTGGTSLSLEERALMANEIFADAFISIHVNASTVPTLNGTSTYFYAPPGTEPGLQRDTRKKLAETVQDKLVEHLSRNNLGVREENLAVLRLTEVPSILVETAFVSNSEEEALLSEPEFRRRAALAISEGLARYFGDL